MFAALLNLALLADTGDPRPTLPTPPKVQMPRLIDGPAPVRPFPFPAPVVGPAVSSPLTLSHPSPHFSTSVWPRFSNSAMPSVASLQAIHPMPANTMVPDGCGSETSFFTPSRVPQAFFTADFSKACDSHDICYGTLWTDKSACDNQFASDLYRSCLTPPRMGRALPMCFGVANTYYTAVRFGGGSAFRQAQMESLMPAQPGPSLFGPAASSFTDQFSLLPRADTGPTYRLGVDTNILQWPPASASLAISMRDYVPQVAPPVLPTPNRGVQVYNAPIGPTPKPPAYDPPSSSWHPPMSLPKSTPLP
jgi:hypothetical protein